MSYAPRPEPPERLESWKEIAEYLRKGVTTVQRWESEHGLPIRRRGKGLGVYAYCSEIDEWLRRPRRPAPSQSSRALAALSRRGVLLGLSVAVAAGIALAVFGDADPAAQGASAPPVRALVQEPGFARYPSFSPDGGRIAYTHSADGIAALYVKELPAGRPRRITPEGLGATGVRWSPSGEWIAFAATVGQTERDIVVISPDGTEMRTLFRIDHGRLEGEYAGWTPDGAAIVFANQPNDGDPLRIERFDIATGGRETLTAPEPGSGGDYYPNVSPNGALLAFARCFRGSEGCLPYVQDLTTGNVWPISEAPGSLRGLAWTPDSRAVAAARRVDGPQNLWLYRVAPGIPDENPVRLTSHPERVYHPVLVPAGSPGAVRFAYERQSSDDNIWRLDLLDPDSEPERVVKLIGHENQPAVSRDGSRLAFGADAGGSTEAWIAEGDGSNPRQLTDFGKTFVGNASWSADSRSLLVWGPYATRLYDIESGRYRKLKAGDVWTSWARGKKSFYARGEDGRGSGLFLFDFDGGFERATPGKAFFGLPGPRGRYLYYSKGKRMPLGLWRTPIGGGGEELVVRNARGTEWTVVEDGILYMEAVDGSGEIREPIRFRKYRPSDGADELLRGLPEDVISVERGFSATWDGRWAYWSQRDSVQSNILQVFARE